MSAPDTVLLVHGFWVTPRSWEHWIAHYESKGYRVLAPAYPGFDVEVEALREDPTPIVDLDLKEAVARFERAMDELDQPPVIIGHSAGGAITQILLDHGYGAAGVALNSAPTEGVPVAPWSQIRSTWPILHNPIGNRHKAIGFSLEQWEYAFTNGLPEDLTRETYERYHIPASGRVLIGSVTANLMPGHQDTWVDYRTRSAHRCCSSRAPTITSCRRRCRSPMPSTTRPRRRSPSASSSRARTS